MAVQLGGLTISNPLAITPGATSSAPKSSGYFWKGADGKVYVQGSSGINSAGSWDNNTANYWGSRGYTQTPDSPVTHAATANNTAPTGNTTNTSYGGATNGGAATGSAPAIVYPDKSNDIMINQHGLDALGTGRDTGLSTIDAALAKFNGMADDDLNTAGTEYHNQSTENSKDLQVNKQTALERGVQGRQGLFGTLSSLGALNGTGLELANRAVQRGTNEDLTTGANTYAQNQNGLDSGYDTYTRTEKRLKQQAADAADNNKKQVMNDYYKNQQTYLKNIGDDYQAEGKTDQASNYYKQSADLFPSINSSVTPTISLGYTGSAYAAPTLSQYAGKANNTTVQTTPGANVPGNTFAIPGLVALNKKQGA